MGRKVRSRWKSLLFLLILATVLVAEVGRVLDQHRWAALSLVMGLVVFFIARHFVGRRLDAFEGAQKTALQGWKWRRVRYEVLRKYGRRCMLCGTTQGSMHVDHIKPRSKYPNLTYDANNLQVLCESCNLGKSNTFEDDFRASASGGSKGRR